MKHCHIGILCCAMAFCLGVALNVSAQGKQKLSVPTDMGRWITTTFAKGKVPPFSFTYNDASSATFITEWKHDIRRESGTQPNVVRYTVTYTEPKGGLQVTCDVTGYNDYNAVDWVLHFTNKGKGRSGTIENVKSMDYALQCAKGGSYVLYHNNGSKARRSDFQPFATSMNVGNELSFSPQGGRSSDETAFPFYNIEAPDHHGVVLAIGWTGNWYARFCQEAAQSLQVEAGMKNLSAYLNAGESIRTPLVSMMFWQDENRFEGHNKFRRFILAHNSPKVNGQVAQGPLCSGIAWGDPAPCEEYSCLDEMYAVSIIRRYKQFGLVPEVYWLDAGWFKGDNIWTGIGNWVADSIRFPHGLKPLADEIHRQGAKFMVWFEPERVYEGTKFAVEHPEWMLHAGQSLLYLYDLGNPEAREWLQQYIGDFLEDNGIDYYRQDFNFRPEDYWTANDEPGRTGIREIRHIEGLYAYWDYLRERFPNLVIDNCASGGRRIDLETVRRSIPLWRSDYEYGEPNGAQCHTYGLNLFLPIHGTGLFTDDDYHFRSALAGSIIMAFEVNTRRANLESLRQRMADYKALRPYYSADYYPLTGIPDLTGDSGWLAYQLNRPSDHSGIVLAFSRQSDNNHSLPMSLYGLEPGLTYYLSNCNDGSVKAYTGEELMRGIVYVIDKTVPGSFGQHGMPGSLLVRYSTEKPNDTKP